MACSELVPRALCTLSCSEDEGGPEALKKDPQWALPEVPSGPFHHELLPQPHRLSPACLSWFPLMAELPETVPTERLLLCPRSTCLVKTIPTLAPPWPPFLFPSQVPSTSSDPEVRFPGFILGLPWESRTSSGHPLGSQNFSSPLCCLMAHGS